jgi:hypothetical protein
VINLDEDYTATQKPVRGLPGFCRIVLPFIISLFCGSGFGYDLSEMHVLVRFFPCPWQVWQVCPGLLNW